MPLNEAEKQKIKEEEKYREAVKKEIHKTSLWKKWWFWVGLFILVILLNFPRSLGSNQKTQSVTNIPTQIDNQASKNNEDRIESTKKTEITKQPSIRSYQLGETFSVQSDISDYNTFKWDITKTSLTKLDDYKVTNSLTPRTLTPKNGKFYIISFEGINRGNKAWYISISFADKMVLIDKNGKKYARNNSDAESAYLVYSHKYPTTDVANPDETTSVPILFDVPEQEYRICDENMKLFCIEGIK